MASDFKWNDRYAGDEAWTEWFEICSVEGCRPDRAAALRAQVASAMYGQLARYGFRREDVGTDDPIAFFDSFFKLKGSRESPKPLKSYFRYRIEAEGLRLVDFVCGTLFGSGSGRVRDIVIDWISACKGWKARTVTEADGKRHLSWENAGADPDAAAEVAAGNDPALFLDEEPLRRAAEGALGYVAEKVRVEKTKVALLLYATALDISITEKVVLEALGTGKSRAYALREAAMRELERELKRREGSDDPLFGRLLVETCERALEADVRKRLAGGNA